MPSPRRAGRRLGALTAHLAAADVETTVELDAALLDSSAEALAAGELDPRSVPPEVIRELMRPEPDFLGFSGQPTETERLLADALAVPTSALGMLPEGPLFDERGRMTAQALAALQARKAQAAEQEDYRMAQYLKSLIDALGPEPLARSIEDCVGDPADPAKSAELFFRHGFVVLRNCFSPEATARMMAAWEAAEATARPSWEGARRASRGIARHGFPPSRVPEGVPTVSRKFYGIEGSLFDLDDAFVDLIDTP